jgi:hypothetical protein
MSKYTITLKQIKAILRRDAILDSEVASNLLKAGVDPEIVYNAFKDAEKTVLRKWPISKIMIFILKQKANKYNVKQILLSCGYSFTEDE